MPVDVNVCTFGVFGNRLLVFVLPHVPDAQLCEFSHERRRMKLCHDNQCRVVGGTAICLQCGINTVPDGFEPRGQPCLVEMGHVVGGHGLLDEIRNVEVAAIVFAEGRIDGDV